MGSIFFERTVTAEVYHGIVMQFISLLEPDKRDCIFQQDGVTAHTAMLCQGLVTSTSLPRLSSVSVL